MAKSIASPNTRAPICLFLALAIFPGAVLAEGWDNFFPVLGGLFLFSIFAFAQQIVWWLAAGAVLAWGYHFYRGTQIEDPHGLWSPGQKLGEAPTFGRSLSWTLLVTRWTLTLATVFAMIIVGIGHGYGLTLKRAPQTASPEEEQERQARQSWNRKVPNGAEWPRTTGYLAGMSVDASQPGGGEVVLNNVLGTSRLYARLCAVSSPSLDLKTACVVKRHLFIERGESLQVSDIAKGGYTIQVIDVLSANAYVSPYIDWRTSFTEPLRLDLPSHDQIRDFQPLPSKAFNAR